MLNQFNVITASKIGESLGLGDKKPQQPTAIEEDVGQTLAQQENVQISGSQARQLMMQRLLRASDVS